MKHIALIAALSAVGAAAQGSDSDLTSDALARFLKSKGASHVGAEVRWDVPSGAFVSADRTLGGFLLFVHQGVGIVAEDGATGLAEVRRRGGTAVVRGIVRAWPSKNRRPGDPSHVLLVRDLSYKRRSASQSSKRRTTEREVAPRKKNAAPPRKAARPLFGSADGAHRHEGKPEAEDFDGAGGLPTAPD